MVARKEGIATLYQFGRKDAFPGTDESLPQGSFNKNAGDNMSITNGIQNPQNFYTWGGSWYNNPPAGYSSTTFGLPITLPQVGTTTP